MNIQTASDLLTDMENRLCESCKPKEWNEDWHEAVDIAKDAMSYRKPMQPLEQERIPFSSNRWVGICPRCCGIVNSQQDYCDFCGQALDWESNE